MGATTSNSRRNRLSNTSEVVPNNYKQLKEHKRYGFVTVKINSVHSNRRNGDGVMNQIVTPKGCILYGSLYNPLPIQKALSLSGIPMLIPGDMLIPDSRAHKLLVTYCRGWHLIPFPEVFSRHSGTCLIVGDRQIPSTPFPIKIGDCFRLGSVGLVVSEVKIDGHEEQKIDAKTLQFLKDEALAFDTNEDLAALATDELGELDNSNHSKIAETIIDNEEPNHSGGLTNGERFICYMCYETHNTYEDPLIAPCECKGDTRFLHVQCLQKWYHSSVFGTHSQVIRTTGNGAPACKICGAAYKTNFRRPDGKKANILELESEGPYMSLVVVTHHDTNPGLFNTKFRLNFGRRRNAPPTATDEELNTIIIGRSSTCNMILDYRTVSTIHAKITHSNGKFYLSDNRSSNGTMVYIRDPLPINYSQPVKLRMGRTTITVQAKRAWTAALRSAFFGSQIADVKERDTQRGSTASVEVEDSSPTPEEIQFVYANLNTNSDKNDQFDSQSHQPNFLNARSYTTRTLNEASIEGGEFDNEAGHYQDYSYPASYSPYNNSSPDPFRRSSNLSAHAELVASNSSSHSQHRPNLENTMVHSPSASLDPNIYLSEVNNMNNINNINNSNSLSRANTIPTNYRASSPGSTSNLNANQTFPDNNLELYTAETLDIPVGPQVVLFRDSVRPLESNTSNNNTVVQSTFPSIVNNDKNNSSDDDHSHPTIRMNGMNGSNVSSVRSFKGTIMESMIGDERSDDFSNTDMDYSNSKMCINPPPSSPHPIHACSPQLMGSNASIVVINNIEEGVVFSASHNPTPEIPEDREKQENMFNSLPVSGMFAGTNGSNHRKSFSTLASQGNGESVSNDQPINNDSPN